MTAITTVVVTTANAIVASITSLVEQSPLQRQIIKHTHVFPVIVDIAPRQAILLTRMFVLTVLWFLAL